MTNTIHALARVGLPTVVCSLFLSGCFDEGLDIRDLDGRVIITRDAALQARFADDGTPIEVDDVRAIGPVYVGLYSGMDYASYRYPHPVQGLNARTYPYGGTTVGDIRNACLQALSCKVISGRFVDFDDLVDWFTNELGETIRDVDGTEVTNGEYIRQVCFDLLELTDDKEIRVTATEDRNDDGEINELDLDFVQDENGDWIAEFDILQQEFEPGFTAWAFMDAPGPSTNKFNTCEDDGIIGYFESTYARRYRAGVQRQSVLDQPFQYLEGSPEDRVATLGYTWNDPYATAEIVIDFRLDVDTIDPSLSGGDP